jgi:hypothetical protein
VNSAIKDKTIIKIPGLRNKLYPIVPLVFLVANNTWTILTLV